jgi:phage FluMu gp28-like protein
MGELRNLWVWRPYQRRILQDRSKLVAVVKARQVGLTELAAVLAVLIACSQKKHDVWLLGVNLEGAKEILWRAKAWYQALALDTRALPKIRSESTEQIVFANKSRITALPCAAKATRGKTGTLILDEFAHVPDDEEIWTAIAPVVSSSSKLRILMFSTPFGERGVFYRACHGLLDGENQKWSVHRIDVHKAIEEGHSPDVLDLRPSFTEEQWSQEFLCSFLSQADKYFPASLIQSCLEKPLPDGYERVVEKRVLGIDLASKRDQSVTIDLDYDGEGGFRIYNPVVLSSRSNPKSYAEQFEILKEKIKHGQYDKVIVDATGPGAGLASFLKAEFGHKIVEHQTTHGWKATFIPAMKVDMERLRVELENNTSLTHAVNAVKETRSSANNAIFTMPRDTEGHADLFSAALMAYSVVKKFPAQKQAPPIKVRPGVAKRQVERRIQW